MVVHARMAWVLVVIAQTISAKGEAPLARVPSISVSDPEMPPLRVERVRGE